MAASKMQILNFIKSKLPKSRKVQSALFASLFAVAGTAVLLTAHAATDSSSIALTPQAGVMAGNAQVVSDSSAIAGQAMAQEAEPAALPPVPGAASTALSPRV